MVETHFDSYGERARLFDNLTEISGRYRVQEEAERRIVGDLIRKLRIESTDDLLEIGCGVGNLLIPLSFYVNSVMGIDHPELIKRFQERFKSDKLTLSGGSLQAQVLTQKFDKILVYSVLPVMPDREALFDFVDKACSLLKESGRMVFGDINSTGCKKRFLESDQGRKFIAEWDKIRRENSGSKEPHVEEECVEFSDELVMELLLYLRKKGFHSYIEEQASNLPFGNSREDIIVVGCEWKSAHE